MAGSNAGWHGHKYAIDKYAVDRYAIDAMLCATAVQQPGAITIPTSDPDDLRQLTAEHPRIAVRKI
ncbi:hypothetical protein [Nocardia paucivorans]|uniref:hypothetical protein n=1 Tax=Nocardia paucivorans TaxID=114259 RepID=UPI0002F3D38E|nr:hypothetical protein [Nocardia paucivorans]